MAKPPAPLLARISRIEGQIRGVSRMVEYTFVL